MAEDQNNKENTTTSDTNNTSEYEDVCYICRRPEHIAGKMIKIPNNICICQDCMQKTFDSMNQTGFSMDDMLNMNMGKMPNISMINLSDLQGGLPNNQKLKKKKPKKKLKQKKRKQKIPLEPKRRQRAESRHLYMEVMITRVSIRQWMSMVRSIF